MVKIKIALILLIAISCVTSTQKDNQLLNIRSDSDNSINTNQPSSSNSTTQEQQQNELISTQDRSEELPKQDIGDQENIITNIRAAADQNHQQYLSNKEKSIKNNNSDNNQDQDEDQDQNQNQGQGQTESQQSQLNQQQQNNDNTFQEQQQDQDLLYDRKFQSDRQYMLQQTNILRAQYGASPVVLGGDTLNKIAQQHSNDMVIRQFFSHDNPEGERARDRARRNGYSQYVGQNIAVASAGIQSCQQAFIKSPTHLSNAIDRRWKSVGVGIAYKPNAHRNVTYVTMVFSQLNS